MGLHDKLRHHNVTARSLREGKLSSRHEKGDHTPREQREHRRKARGVCRVAATFLDLDSDGACRECRDLARFLDDARISAEFESAIRTIEV